MVVAVVPAEERDLDAMVELLQHLFAQEEDFSPNAELQRCALTMLMASPELGRVFVARMGGRCVGMVSLLFTVSTAEGGLGAWLEDMVVLPECRSEGIGAELIERAIEDCRARGIHRVTLLTDRSNGSAQRFYLRHGFKPSSMLPFRLHC